MPTYPTTGLTSWGPALKAFIVASLPYVDVTNNTYNADPTGVTTSDAAFTAAIASGAKTLFVPAGTYSISGGLVFNQANQTILIAAGATLQVKTAGTQNIIQITANGVQIIGNGTSTIDGNNVGTTAGSTIYVNAATDVTIAGLTLINCAGIAINGQGDRVDVTNNTITNCGNAAIYFQNPTTLVDLEAPQAVGNRISVASGLAYGIQSHVSGARVIKRPRFAYNDIKLPATNPGGIGIELFGGNSFGSVIGNTIEGSIIGISVDSGPSIAVTGNSIHGAYNYGIEFASASNSTASGNSIDGNALTNTGISISNTAGGNNTVSGNTISNLLANAGKGIQSQQAAGNATCIVGNNITCYQPVVISSNSGHNVTGNVLTCVGAGTLTGVSFNTVVNSIAAYNTINNATTGAVNVFTGTMNGIIVGPNVLLGTTTVDLLNGWTPGTNGVGSRLIRANIASAGFTTPTVGASPYTYTNTSKAPQYVYIRGGTVSVIARGATTVAVASPATVYCDPGETVVITYTVAPTVVVDSK